MYADRPLSLITTPNFQTNKTDQFTMDASHMALVHNVIIRGYNSIYLQAPKIILADVPDFVSYCLAWHEEVVGHHQSEEEVLFPMIEEGTGVQGIMDDDKAEHDSFTAGLSSLKSYLDTCVSTPTTYSGAEVVRILESFGSDLHSHLAHEPPKLVSLASYGGLSVDSASTPGAPSTATYGPSSTDSERFFDIKAASHATAQHSMRRTSPVTVLPMLWYNLDVEFEGGRWAGFPEVPQMIKWVMIHVVGQWRSSWWRFGSSGADGRQRELMALKEGYGARKPGWCW